MIGQSSFKTMKITSLICDWKFLRFFFTIHRKKFNYQYKTLNLNKIICSTLICPKIKSVYLNAYKHDLKQGTIILKNEKSPLKFNEVTIQNTQSIF